MICRPVSTFYFLYLSQKGRPAGGLLGQDVLLKG